MEGETSVLLPDVLRVTSPGPSGRERVRVENGGEGRVRCKVGVREDFHVVKDAKG